jgi:predicted nuclease of predicted toxin-antitoxin system
MNGFLFDENLPSQIRFVPSLPISHTSQIGPRPTDSQIWEFARGANLVIVSKDADFSQRIIKSTPPPWVVHIRFGNLRRNDFHAILGQMWPRIETMVKTHKMLNVYQDRIEGVH